MNVLYHVGNTLKTEGQTVTKILNKFHQTPRGYTQKREGPTQRKIINKLLKENTQPPRRPAPGNMNIQETPQFYKKQELQEIKEIIENMNITRDTPHSGPVSRK